MKLSDIDCSKVKDLDGIQGNGSIDETGKYKGIDKTKVSCMQKYYLDEEGNKKTANELKTMIKRHYNEYADDEDFYKALCTCCQLKDKGFPNIQGSNQWEKLYNCLEKKGYKKS